MNTLNRLLCAFTLFLCFPAYSADSSCCQGLMGIQYCDRSAGRYVCHNGEYSRCYCSRHAVMDLNQVTGCCLWQGGVFKVSPMGLVICNDGGVSNICGRNQSVQAVPSF